MLLLVVVVGVWVCGGVWSQNTEKSDMLEVGTPTHKIGNEIR